MRIKWLKPKRIDLGNARSGEKQCYGVSIKWWPHHKMMWLPVMYPQDGRDRHYNRPYKRYAMGWLKATIVLYWPIGGGHA